MILEIDAGNTRLKWRMRDGAVKMAEGSGPSADNWSWLFESLKALPAPERILMASVLAPSVSGEFVDWCQDFWRVSVEFARSTAQCAGVRNGYTDPERLGVDRWLALLAARAQSSAPLLVVDAGSAVTVDLLDSEGQHLGGYIGPGLQLMARALGRDTQGVQVALADSLLIPAPGRDTRSAVNGALAAMVTGLVEQARRELVARTGIRPTEVVVTGGDAKLVCECMAGAQEMPELVLDGLQLALPLE